MRQRTPSEIKAYGDGYAEAYKEFCHLLDRHDKDKAIRKMKIFADAVALTVETATDEPQTDTEIAKAIVHKMIDDAVIAEDAYPDLRQKMHDAVDEYEPQTDCAWK